MKFGSTLTMAIAAAGIGLSAPVLAQEQSQDSTQEQAQGQTMDQAQPDIPEIAAEDVTQGQITSFVNAMIALEEIRAEYLPQIQAAEDQEERVALAAEADDAAKTAVDEVTGITPNEYLAIGRAAQGNEELGQKITARFAELRETQQQDRTPLQQPAQNEGEDGSGETMTE